MRLRFVTFALAFLVPSIRPIIPLLGAQQMASGGGGEELVYSVRVMRHGVRSPTADPSQYNRFASAPWPAWSVAPGYLTPHGFELIKLLGAYNREELAGQGLLTAAGCDDAKRIPIHADSDQRTRETARAMVEGMFPSCSVAIRENDEGVNDPLFHLAAGSVTPEQSKLGAAAVLARVGNDPANVAVAYRAPLVAFDKLLANCGVPTPKADRTSLLSIPASIAPGKGDHIAEMRGPINTASTLSEIMLLEYAEGMPATNVGWGCVDGPALRELINLHTVASELSLRTPAVAIPQAASLLRVIGSSMEQAATHHAVAGAEGKPDDKLLLLVGHDTNLTNIAGALQLDWLIDGRRNDTPPGSALIFELWRTRTTGELRVRLAFATQTLEQMRNSTTLSIDQAPPRVAVFVPGCSSADGSCTLRTFAELFRDKLATVPAVPSAAQHRANIE